MAGSIRVAIRQFDPGMFSSRGLRIVFKNGEPEASGVGCVELRFVDCRNGDKREIAGEEWLQRFYRRGLGLYGVVIGRSLLMEYKDRGRSSVLERLRRGNITAISFMRDILVDSVGRHCAMYLYCNPDSGVWGWDYDLLSNPWPWGFTAVF